jgi:hypothetical protein
MMSAVVSTILGRTTEVHYEKFKETGEEHVRRVTITGWHSHNKSLMFNGRLMVRTHPARVFVASYFQ